MSNWTRRRVFCGAAALSALPLLGANKQAAGATKAPKPLVHTTDLFRPFNDPDDHWDLATAYALACQGDLDLLGVLTDNPENFEQSPELLKVLASFVDDAHVARSPDVAAVAQLIYLTERAVPITTGTIWPTTPGEKVRANNLPKKLQGVNMLLGILERSSQPVAIIIGGSCQDVAIAGEKAPKLFTEKCAGIYLNAGIGSQNPKEQSIGGNVEWNVSLNRGAYATIFELPCPIYWMPCFGAFDMNNDVAIREHGTFWSFQYKEVVPYLSNRMQAYFAYVLSKESGTNWLSYLLDSKSANLAHQYFEKKKGMWTTTAFVHAAGKTVTVDGKVVAPQAAVEDAVFDFVPIEVHCDENGITEWQQAKGPTDRYIFRVRDGNKYPKAMLAALKSMLLALP